MRLSKTALLGGVAALALGVSTIGVTSEANAFTDVDWEWDLESDQKIEKNITIDITLAPIGDITDQILQIQIGHVTAESYVNGVYNKPIREKKLTPTWGYEKVYEKEVDLEAELDFELEAEIEAELEAEKKFGFIGKKNGKWFGGFGAGGIEAELEAEIEAEIEAELDFELDLETREKFILSTLQHKSLDALKELPHVVSSATAVGNSINVTSTNAMVEEHSMQLVADTIWGDRDSIHPPFNLDVEASVEAEYELELNDNDVDTENFFHNFAITRVLAASAGFIDKAEISATSEVYNIYNATVDSSATAVGNIKTIDLEVTEKELDSGHYNDAVVLADITQVSIANVSATSKVGSGEKLCKNGYCYGDGVTIYGYHNLGDLTHEVNGAVVKKPIVNSVATAIGNAVNITVGREVK